MCGSPDDIGEVPVTYVKERKGCRMTCDVGGLILQPFRRFTYVTSHSPTLLSLHLRHRHFTYVTWRAACGLNRWHNTPCPGQKLPIRNVNNSCTNADTKTKFTANERETF